MLEDLQEGRCFYCDSRLRTDSTAVELPRRLEEYRLAHDHDGTLRITRWAYQQVERADGWVWVRGNELVPLGEEWEELLRVAQETVHCGMVDGSPASVAPPYYIPEDMHGEWRVEHRLKDPPTNRRPVPSGESGGSAGRAGARSHARTAFERRFSCRTLSTATRAAIPTPNPRCSPAVRSAARPGRW